jgi:membrane protein DedA with SNARE-associated domain
MTNFNKLKNNPPSDHQFQWTKFAGLASQWAVALILLLFAGKYLDKQHFFSIQIPLFIWLLPFLFIIISLLDIIKKTNKKSGNASDK